MAERPRATTDEEDALGSVLTQLQILGEADVSARLAEARNEGRFLEEVLIGKGVLSAAQLSQVLENHHFTPAADLSQTPFSPEALALIPRRIADRHLALPFAVTAETIRVVLGDPGDRKTVELLERAAGRNVQVFVALRHEIRRAIDEAYGRFEKEASRADEEASAAKLKPEPARRKEKKADLGLKFKGHDPVAVVDEVMQHALALGATDIHFEPGREQLVIRFRLDGVLQEAVRFPIQMAPGVASRIKVLGAMDISEKRVPQDGRLAYEVDGTSVDLRLSSLPSQYGETIVIRILAKSQELLDLDTLSMPPAIREAVDGAAHSPRGLFLVTGPTGSGKTTTLYATLNAVDRESVKVITLEDPIEYSLPSVTQSQVNAACGMTFTAGLSSILRQDPDVVLVGEIRDLQTVEIACRAALTGHLVFSTLHTNDACQAVTRLVDMGVAPHLIAATLRGVLAQRLVRLICEGCRATYEPTESELALLGSSDVKELEHGTGCADCSQTGYKGRMAIYEWFTVDVDVQRLVLERAPAQALKRAAQRAGLVSLADHARQAVLQGRTTVAEVQRVIFTGEDREQTCPSCTRFVSTDFAICPFCQTVLKESCPSCKSAVEGHWEACAACGTELDREKTYCRHCVAPIAAGSAQCDFCGVAQ